MECQSVAGPGAAPAGVAAADMSACLPESVGRGSLVTEDHREVGPLSRGVMSRRPLNPCPARYRPAVASSRLLYPLPRQVALRLPSPVPGWGARGATGLPRSACVIRWGV